MSIQNTPYSSPARLARQSSFGWLHTALLVLILSLATGLIQIHTFFTYQTYQQGQCTILSGTTDYHSSRGGSYYTPDFQYIVTTKDGQQVSTSGYDAPYQQDYYTQNDAQQVVNGYTMGQSYTCWYNPVDPTHAVLVFRGYTIGNFILDYTLTTLAYLIGYGFLRYLIYVFYRQVCLIRRGVLTEGKVTRNFERRGKYGTKTYSSIVFSPLDDPSQVSTVDKKGAYPVGSQQPVCYDPVNPYHAKYGGRARGGRAAMALAGFLVGTLIAAAYLLGFWYGA
jgi:hypothetical protein